MAKAGFHLNAVTYEMAWMLLMQRMPDDRSNRLKFPRLTPRLNPCLTPRLALASSLAAWLLASSAAWGQTGFSTTRLASQHDEFVGLQAKPEHLSHLQGQPQLEKHLVRINRFRTLFHTDDEPSDHEHTGLPQTQLASATVVPRAGSVPETDVTDLAILELEDSMSSRQYPSTFYPGVGLVFALKTISKWSEESMISALRAGAVPIYNQSGEVIGVEDSDTGMLLGGRRS
jgi:hypothetical protein